MLRYLICFSLLSLLLTGCSKTIPDALLTPCVGPDWSKVKTEGQLSNAIVSQTKELHNCNSKITAIRKIAKNNKIVSD